MMTQQRLDKLREKLAALSDREDDASTLADLWLKQVDQVAGLPPHDQNYGIINTSWRRVVVESLTELADELGIAADGEGNHDD